jgi:hypothetical protein
MKGTGKTLQELTNHRVRGDTGSLALEIAARAPLARTQLLERLFRHRPPSKSAPATAAAEPVQRSAPLPLPGLQPCLPHSP